VPDDVICALVTARIKQPDCQIHGFVLDGFPKTTPQIQLLEEMKIQPTVIVILECLDEDLESRLSSKKIDPQTGIAYDMNNLTEELPEHVIKRLLVRNQDHGEALEKR
jgi:adenylate kinase